MGTIFSHYYYTSTFRTARREGLPSTHKRGAFGLWPFGHSAADEEKAFNERIKSYTSKGFSNRPDNVPVERPVQNGQRYSRDGGDSQSSDYDDSSTGGKVKHFFSRMMPGHHSDSSDRGDSDQEPLQARYQYPHHDMKGDKYLNEGNAASTTDGESTTHRGNGNGNGQAQGQGQGHDGDGYHDVDLDEKSHYTDARTNLSPPTSWADRKRIELEQQREQRAKEIPGGYDKPGNRERARQPSAVDYANGNASPRQEAAQRYAQEKEYAARADANKDGSKDPVSAASHLKRENKRGAHDAARQGQEVAHGQDPRGGGGGGGGEGETKSGKNGNGNGGGKKKGNSSGNGHGHGKVHPEGTGRQGQQQGEAVVDGPRKAGQGAGKLRDTPYGPKGQAPGLGAPAGGIDSRRAKHAYGY